MPKQLIIIVSITVAVLAADQLTKAWARNSLRPPTWPSACRQQSDCRSGHHCRAGYCKLELLEGYLDFEYHENRGSAFGLLRNVPGARFILIAVGLLAMVLVWRLVKDAPGNKHAAHFAFALVAGGAVGNLIDRIYLGRVVDFILMHWQHRYRWPAYNIADIALVVGVGVLVIVLGKKPDPSGAPTSGRKKS